MRVILGEVRPRQLVVGSVDGEWFPSKLPQAKSFDSGHFKARQGNAMRAGLWLSCG